MNRQDEHIDALIASYLTGEASTEEIAFLDAWKARSEDNRRHFEHFKLIFEHATAAVPGEAFNADVAWERLQRKLPRRAKSISLPSWDGRWLLRFAAAVTLLITVAVFLYRSGKPPASQTVRIASGQAMRSDTLVDGSGVFLNRQTTVEYSYHGEDNRMTVNLVGEAYFDISHDEEKIFIVEAEGTLIKDIGTAFNVKAYPDSSTIEVFVEEGEVVFYTAHNPGITLKANARGVYHKDTQMFTVGEIEPNVTSYKNKSFTFDNQSLEAVARTLNQVYDTKIAIGENLKGCRITVSFNDESVDEIAQIIGETLGLSLSRSQDTITLTGDGCAEANEQ